MTKLEIVIPGRLPRKNDRHTVIRVGGKGRLMNSSEHRDFCLRLKLAMASIPWSRIDAGEWRISLDATAGRQSREGFPFVDIDACISAVLDGLQKIGVIDNDMRFGEATLTRAYRKNEPSLRVTLERRS